MVIVYTLQWSLYHLCSPPAQKWCTCQMSRGTHYAGSCTIPADNLCMCVKCPVVDTTLVQVPFMQPSGLPTLTCCLCQVSHGTHKTGPVPFIPPSTQLLTKCLYVKSVIGYTLHWSLYNSYIAYAHQYQFVHVCAKCQRCTLYWSLYHSYIAYAHQYQYIRMFTSGHTCNTLHRSLRYHHI